MILFDKRSIILLAIGFPLLVLGEFFPFLIYGFTAFGLSLIAALVFDFFSIPRKNDLSVTRSHDKYLSLGADNPITLLVQNKSLRKLNIVARDEYPLLCIVETDTLTANLAKKGKTALTYWVKPVKKGDYAFNQTYIRVKGKLGLLMRQYRYPVKTEFKVYPNLRDLKQYLRMMANNRIELLGYKSRTLGGENEFDHLRDYAPGDTYREIYWKATAKRRFPVTRVNRREENRNVLTLLDCGRMMTTRYGILNKLDYAVDTALILAASCKRNKDGFGSLLFGDRILSYKKPSAGKPIYSDILKSLYKIEPEFVKTDYEAAYRFLKTRLTKNSILFVFSELYNRIVSKELYRFLTLLSKYHQVYFVSFEEIEAEAAGKNYRQVTRWIVQEKENLEKETLIRELKQIGVKTIRVNPENIKQQVVNTYLEL